MKGIWNELYGKRDREFIDGVKAGVEMYARWKDGKQVVGVLEQPLEEVFEEIEQQMGEDG